MKRVITATILAILNVGLVAFVLFKFPWADFRIPLIFWCWLEFYFTPAAFLGFILLLFSLPLFTSGERGLRRAGRPLRWWSSLTFAVLALPGIAMFAVFLMAIPDLCRVISEIAVNAR